jgi:hypothetical protein
MSPSLAAAIPDFTGSCFDKLSMKVGPICDLTLSLSKGEALTW